MTGRHARFGTLRQRGGLSGYPSRSESEHDWVENSHASTTLSYAHGLATALAVQGRRDRRVVAVLGDGSLTGGMAYEALNNLGHSQSNVLILLNDNGRSYAPTVGLLAGLSRLRLSPAYSKTNRARVQRGLRWLPMSGESIECGVEGMGAAARQFVLSPSSSPEAPGAGASLPEAALHPGYFFEALGVGYVGPVDGHDVVGLERVLELVEIGERDPRVVAITAAMAGPTGLRAFQDRWPDRVMDVGIAEQHAVTAAAGVAMAGLRPVVAIYSTFITRALDQVNLDVGLHRLPVVFCLDRAGITGEDGPSHHGVLDLALLSRIPGLTVLAPSSAEELHVMLGQALALDAPVAIRFPKGAARPVTVAEVGVGLKARLVREGDDVCILAVGKLVERAEEAARLLEQHGIRPTVWDVRAVKPLDPCMRASAASHRLVVTAEDGVRLGGAGSAIAAALAIWARERGTVAPQVLTTGLPDRHVPHGRVDAILAEHGLDAAGLVASDIATSDAYQVAGRR